VDLVVQVPVNISGEAKEILRQYDELTGGSLSKGAGEGTGAGADGKKKKKGFMDKIKESLDDM
jgi:molecular chaperone DnaJ